MFNNEFRVRLSLMTVFSYSLICSSKTRMESILVSQSILCSGRVRTHVKGKRYLFTLTVVLACEIQRVVVRGVGEESRHGGRGAGQSL